jgi:hypothetical protein
VSNLTVLLQDEGDFAAAGAPLRQALAARERTLGKEHPDTVSSVNNLAALLSRKGDYSGVEPLARLALEASEHGRGWAGRCGRVKTWDMMRRSNTAGPGLKPRPFLPTEVHSV